MPMLSENIDPRIMLCKTIRITAFAFNTVLALVFLLAACRLWAHGDQWIEAAGGMPQPNTEYLRRLAVSAGLKERLVWWIMAWTAYVFSAGCALLAFYGARDFIWRLHSMLHAANGK